MLHTIASTISFLTGGLHTILLVWPALWISWIWHCICIPLGIDQNSAQCNATIDAVTAAAADFHRIVDIRIEWLHGTVGVYPTLAITVVIATLLSCIVGRLMTTVETTLNTTNSITANICAWLIGIYSFIILLMIA